MDKDLEISKVLDNIKENNNLKINKIEEIVGDGDEKKGLKVIKNVLKELAKEGFTQATIGEMVGKDRHMIHKWYKRYKIKPLVYTEFKPSLIKLTFDRKKHNIKHGRYEKVNGKYYRVFYLYPTPLFAYMVGLILGDGSIDDRKIYITGGKPFDFLDKTYTRVMDFAEYLGNRSVRIKYYDTEDNELDREDSNVTSWRLYIYWSALSHALKNKESLNDILEKIWSNPGLFTAFTGGLFDADGYFSYSNKKPERIGLQQIVSKWWFIPFCKKLEESYSIKTIVRKRDYSIKRRKKIYKGTTKANIITMRQPSWSRFVDKVVLKYCNKPIHLERAPLFAEHSIKMRNRWHV